MDNKAVILAGGFGTRLRPITDTTQKTMIPVHDKPVLGHLVDLFKKFGVTDITFALHYTWGALFEPILTSDLDGTICNNELIAPSKVQTLKTADNAIAPLPQG